MKAITRARRAVHLMAHVEDVQRLGKLDGYDVALIQEALFLLIGCIQQDGARHQACLLPGIPWFFPTKHYEFHERDSAPNTILVSEAGGLKRRLKHVPIFSYGFGLRGLPALDAALAILADSFEEPLSLRTFATGTGQSCWYYRAFAQEVLPLGHFETKQIVACVCRESRRWSVCNH